MGLRDMDKLLKLADTLFDDMPATLVDAPLNQDTFDYRAFGFENAEAYHHYCYAHTPPFELCDCGLKPAPSFAYRQR